MIRRMKKNNNINKNKLKIITQVGIIVKIMTTMTVMMTAMMTVMMTIAVLGKRVMHSDTNKIRGQQKCPNACHQNNTLLLMFSINEMFCTLVIYMQTSTMVSLHCSSRVQKLRKNLTVAIKFSIQYKKIVGTQKVVQRLTVRELPNHLSNSTQAYLINTYTKSQILFQSIRRKIFALWQMILRDSCHNKVFLKDSKPFRQKIKSKEKARWQGSTPKVILIFRYKLTRHTLKMIQ